VIAKAEAAGKRALVHCRAGAQNGRTGGSLPDDRAQEPWSRALLELERFSHKPLDTSRLLPYLHENLDTMQEMLIQRGVIRDVPPGPRPSEAMDRAGPSQVSSSQPGGGRAAN
jgi:hypothetical protein